MVERFAWLRTAEDECALDHEVSTFLGDQVCLCVNKKTLQNIRGSIFGLVNSSLAQLDGQLRNLALGQFGDKVTHKISKCHVF